MNLNTATPLQRAIYDICLEVEQMPAGDFQTRLVSVLSDAALEMARLSAKWPRLAEAEQIATLTARAEEAERIDNGNTYVFCDVVLGRKGCIRGAGHNGPHVVGELAQPLIPVLLMSLPAPPRTAK